jgi:hypothetical protein
MRASTKMHPVKRSASGTMFDDFKELLSAFKARKVKYLIVGGYAVSLRQRQSSSTYTSGRLYAGASGLCIATPTNSLRNPRSSMTR